MDGGIVTESQTSPSIDDGTSGSHGEEDSSGRKRRQQGKQACQHCRRRKIKCDETRPICRPCVKAKLTCAYELPAGQTRQQALMENQHKIQHELEAHASLIQTLRTLPTDASVRVLTCLREGAYDGVLLSTANSADGHGTPQPDFPAVYPWELVADAGEQDAIGEDDDEYDEDLTSPRQVYAQYNIADMQLNLPTQGPIPQHTHNPYPMMQHPASLGPYNAYYPPPEPYVGDPSHMLSGDMAMYDGMSLPGAQQQYPSQPRQRFQMKAPTQPPPDLQDGSSSTRRPR